jgi:hypothetical protein
MSTLAAEIPVSPLPFYRIQKWPQVTVGKSSGSAPGSPDSQAPGGGEEIHDA